MGTADGQQRGAHLLGGRDVHALQLEERLDRALEVNPVLAARAGEADPTAAPDDGAPACVVDDQCPTAGGPAEPATGEAAEPATGPRAHSVTKRNTSATTRAKSAAR